MPWPRSRYVYGPLSNGQPWPFPSSLMYGFLCEALLEEITVDPEELAEARCHCDKIRAVVARAASEPTIQRKSHCPGRLP